MEGMHPHIDKFRLHRRRPAHMALLELHTATELVVERTSEPGKEKLLESVVDMAEKGSDYG